MQEITTNGGSAFENWDFSFRDLAPGIYRQRLVIEGIPNRPITAEDISDYLNQLSEVLDMRALNEPVTHVSEKFGWAGWIHWESSGAHFYAWEQPQLFFSVDIYTCAPFDDQEAATFTANYFAASQMVVKSL